MYSINYKIGGTTYAVYHPKLAEQGYILSEATAHQAVNEAGSLNMILQHDQPCLQHLQRMRGIVELLDDSVPVFRGRIVRDTEDMYLSRSVECEGVLACLNDSIVPPYDFPGDFEGNPDYIAASAGGNVVQFWLAQLISLHNGQVGQDQQFHLGNVTVSDPNNYISRSNDSFSTTWGTIREKLFESSLGGYLLIRYETDGNYIDYVEDLPLTNVQTVEFAKNLLDINSEVDGTDIWTAILPVGKDGLTIYDLPDGAIDNDLVKSGNIVYSRAAEATQGGRITKLRTWDDVTIAGNLLTKAAAVVAGMALPEAISCNACDLHGIDGTIPSFRVGRYVRVTSTPHGISGLYPLMELDINVLQPAETPIVLSRTTSTLTRSLSSTMPKDGKDGRDGAPGVNGGDGISIIDVNVQYYLSTSDSQLTGGSWQDQVPPITNGTYLWTRDAVSYSDGSTTYTDPMCQSKTTKEIIAPTVDDLTESWSESYTSIARNTESIIAEALTQYVETGNFTEFTEEVRSALSVMSGQIELNLTTTTSRINEVGDDLREIYSIISKYFRFTQDGLIIGESGNETMVRLDNDILQFLRNNYPMLWLDENGGHMEHLYVTVIHIGGLTITGGTNRMTIK